MTTPRKRLIVKRPGSRKALILERIPAQAPVEGEVQVEVKTCGINFADIAVRLGLYEAAKKMYPICPGLEFSGIVSRTARDVEDFKKGDRVFGATFFGGYSSVINCPQEYLWKMPDSWDFSRAASFPVAYLTAYYGLHSVGHLVASDLALVHSAAGGVGTALLHLLKINGNRSVGIVGGSQKVFSAHEAGADVVIDKSRENPWQKAGEISTRGYDIILDANGASTLKSSYNHLAPAGRLIIYGFSSMFSSSGRKNWPKLIWDYIRTPRFSPFDLTGGNKTISGFNLIYLFERVDFFRDIMATLIKWDARGLLPRMPITEFPFEKAREAHGAIESGNTAGKLVLRINGE